MIFVIMFFVRSCLRLWLEQDTTCPTCRVSLGDNQSQRPAEQNNLAQEEIPPQPQQQQQVQNNRLDRVGVVPACQTVSE